MSTIERRINLDTSVPQGMPEFSQSGAGEGRREAADTDRHAFEQALAQPDEPADNNADASTVPRPLDLYATVAAGVPATPPPGLARSLEQAVDRLLVDDGNSGGRREVRITLKEDVLTGVSVAVYQDEGRMVAAFTCSNETSREKLNRCARALAEEMSRSLHQDALVRVSTDDPEDPCLFEVAATA
jgi:hypothetical protein